MQLRLYNDQQLVAFRCLMHVTKKLITTYQRLFVSAVTVMD